MALGSLVVSLEANIAKFSSDMGKAAQIAENESKRMNAAIASVKSLLGGLTVGFSLVALVEGFKSVVESAEHLGNLSKSTGVAVETLGGLGFAAKQSGTDLDGVAKAFGKLNLEIAAAAAGSESALLPFKLMGITLNDLQTLKPDEIFAKIATAFASYADGPEKAALGHVLFKKSYQDIIPLLDEGGAKLQENIEYFRAYGGITEEITKQSKQFEDSVKKLGLLSGSFGRTLAADVLPTMQALIDALVEAKQKSTAFATVASIIGEVFRTVIVLGANVGYVFQQFGRELEGIGAQLYALAHGDFKGFSLFGEQMKKDAAQARKDIDAFSDRILNLNPQAKITYGGDIGADNAPEKRRAPRLPSKDAVTAITSAYQNFLEQLDLYNKKLQEGEYAELREKARLLATKEGITNLTGAYDRINQRQRVDSVKAIEVYSDVLEKQNKLYQFQTSILGENALAQLTLTAAMQARAGEEQKILQLQNAGKPLDQQGLADLRSVTDASLAIQVDAIRQRYNLERDFQFGAHKFFQSYIDDANNAAQQAQNFFSNAFQTLESVLEKFITTGKLDFRGLADSIIADLARIEAKKIIASLAGGLDSSLSAGGGFLGFFAGLFGGGGAGAGLALAGGGDPPPGRISLVGENGPEFFVPRSAGTVVPQGGLGGRHTVIINQSIDARGADSGVDQRIRSGMQQATADAVREVGRQLQRNGPMAGLVRGV